MKKEKTHLNEFNLILIKNFKLIYFIIIFTFLNANDLFADCGVPDPDLIITSNGALGGGYYNQNIIITGTGTVVTINNTTILMGDGMKIFVDRTCSLNVVNSVLDSRCSVMWWGGGTSRESANIWYQWWSYFCI